MCEARTEAKTKTDEIILSLNRLADVLERLLGSGAPINPQASLASPEK